MSSPGSLDQRIEAAAQRFHTALKRAVARGLEQQESRLLAFERRLQDLENRVAEIIVVFGNLSPSVVETITDEPDRPNVKED